ncbi:uncharacterized protein isoform X2 [Danio rerio]|uniref:Uncharacterized protein isoform X2 n=1 Tax=Danio rerio TaxID=7955 RepID=A0AC58HHX1_DANRE
MSSVLDDFFACPSEALIERCTKEELIQIAERFSIDLTTHDKKKKDTLMATLKRSLVERGVLEVRTAVLCESSVFSSCDIDVESELKFPEMSIQEKKLYLDAEKLRADREGRAMKERETEREFEARKLEQQLSVRKLELELEREREERAFQLKKLELELAAKRAETPRADVHPVPEQSSTLVFDVHRNMRLVPPFSEKEVEKYFDHFERVALSLKWPKQFWTLLLQCVFTGKAQDIYSALTLEQSGEYETVKTAVLHAYELVPEAYRQKFRNLIKTENCTFVEFAREKESLFERWCTSMKVETKEQLRELLLLEEFKHCVPSAVATYLNEHKVSKLADAAIMADEFVLTHQGTFSSASFRSDMNKFRSCQVKQKPAVVGQNIRAPVVGNIGKTTVSRDLICFYCKKSGHKISECPVLKKKEKFSKPVSLVAPSTVDDTFIESAGHLSHSCGALFDQKVNDFVDYTPFITEGAVSLLGSEEMVPVRILRDTGSAQSFLLEGVLPLSSETATGTCVLVRGFEMGFVDVPLHRIHLSSTIISGDVVVGVRSALPVPGITFILGNDLAGGNVWGESKVTALPIVISAPSKSDVEKSNIFSNLFPACAVTRSMAKQLPENQATDVSLGNTFFSTVDSGEFTCDLPESPEKDKNICSSLSPDLEELTNSPQSLDSDATEVLHTASSDVDKYPLTSLLQVPREELIHAQQLDDTLKTVVSQAGSNMGDLSSYFFEDGLLCRRVAMFDDNLKSRTQIVVPLAFRESVMQLAHQGLAGHTGVRKTYDRIMRQFYWPGVKRDVARFIRSCHTCQLTGLVITISLPLCARLPVILRLTH